jgi:hypothetical protein
MGILGPLLLRCCHNRQSEPDPSVPEGIVDEAAGSYELLFREAARSLSAQESSVDELRSRCGVMLSATGVVSAFLGSVVISGLFGTGGRPTEFVSNGIKLAVLLTILSSVAFVVPIAPMKWRFRVSVQKVLADYVEATPPKPLTEIHRSLAWYFSDAEEANSTKLRRLYWLMTVGASLFVAELLVWFVVVYERLTP